jgi:hypothetical protein
MEEKDLLDFDPSDADEKLGAFAAELRESIKALLEMIYT